MKKYFIPLYALYFTSLIWLALSSKYWYDEAFTYLVSHLDLGHLIAATAADVHPPLHYLLLWWMHVSNPNVVELETRVWSIIAALGSFGIFFLITEKLDLPKAVRVIGLGMFVLCPTQIYYGQEGRMYALFELLVMVQIYAVLTRRWWLVGIATTLELYTHNYSFFFTAVIGLVALVYEVTHTARHIDNNPVYNLDDRLPKVQSNLPGLFLAFGIPVALYLPWFINATIPQLAFFRNGFHWILPVTFGSAFWSLFVSLIGTWYSNTMVLIQFMGILAGLMLVVLSSITAKRYQLMALAFGPWLLAILASVLVAPIMIARAFLPSTPFIFLLIGEAFYRSGLRGRVIGGLLLVPVVVIGLYGLASNAVGGTLHGDNLIEIPEQIDPTVMIVHLDDSTMITSLVYRPGSDQRMLDAGCPEEPGALRVHVRDAMGIKTIKLTDLPAHYYFMASVGALSTTCHQQVYDELISQAKALNVFENAYGRMGFYEHLLPQHQADSGQPH